MVSQSTQEQAWWTPHLRLTFSLQPNSVFASKYCPSANPGPHVMEIKYCFLDRSYHKFMMVSNYCNQYLPYDWQPGLITVYDFLRVLMYESILHHLYEVLILFQNFGHLFDVPVCRVENSMCKITRSYLWQL